METAGRHFYSRRMFLQQSPYAAMAMVTAGSVLLGQTICAAPIEPDNSIASLDLNLPKYAVLKENGGTRKVLVKGVSEPLVILRKSETEFVAFSSKCTHKGGQVNLPKNGIIECPCHGSCFDLAGNVTKGPARMKLSFYATKFNDPILMIDLRKREGL